MILKQQLKNVMLVTTLQKREYYGTNAEVVKFGCLKCVADGTLFMVTHGIFASRWPSFLKFFILIQFYNGFFFIKEILFFVVIQFFMVVSWYLIVTTEVAMEMWSCDITPVKFCSVAAGLLNFFCWYISEQGYCPMQVGVLRIPVLHYVFRDTLTVSQSVWARKWNFHSRSWPLYLSYHNILLPVHIMPCLVHCKTVFSVLNTYRAWHSGVSLRGRYNYNCDRYCPNGCGMPNETVCFFFNPRH
jgi:hypothetical protein